MIENIIAGWTGAEFPAGTIKRVACRYDAGSIPAPALERQALTSLGIFRASPLFL